MYYSVKDHETMTFLLSKDEDRQGKRKADATGPDVAKPTAVQGEYMTTLAGAHQVHHLGQSLSMAAWSSEYRDGGICDC